MFHSIFHRIYRFSHFVNILARITINVQPDIERLKRLYPAIDDSQEVHEMRKNVRCEKKGCARDNMKIDYTRFAIRLFFRTINFYPV